MALAPFIRVAQIAVQDDRAHDVEIIVLRAGVDVVLADDEWLARRASGAFVAVDADGTVVDVGGVRHGAGRARMDMVAVDLRARLQGKRVDARAIGEFAYDAMDMVVAHRVVAQTGQVGAPSPAQADSGVGQVAKLIVFDDGVADKPGCDPDAARIGRADTADIIVGQHVAGGNFARPAGEEGVIGLDVRVGETSQGNAAARDVIKDIPHDPVPNRPSAQVERGGAKLREDAPFDHTSHGELHLECSGHPIVVDVTRRIRRRVGETSLGIQITARRSGPVAVSEGEAGKFQALHRRLRRSAQRHQRLEAGGDHFHLGHVLPCLRPVVNGARSVVLIPFAFRVEKLGGVLEMKRLVVDEFRPRALEHSRLLRISELETGQRCIRRVRDDPGDAENGLGPEQLDMHLRGRPG